MPPPRRPGTGARIGVITCGSGPVSPAPPIEPRAVSRSIFRWPPTPGYTFITAYRDGRFLAFLIDMRGTVQHEWEIAFSEAWPAPQHLEVVPPDFDISLHGAALL